MLLVEILITGDAPDIRRAVFTASDSSGQSIGHWLSGVFIENPASVPEKSSIALLGLGAIASTLSIHRNSVIRRRR